MKSYKPRSAVHDDRPARKAELRKMGKPHEGRSVARESRVALQWSDRWTWQRDSRPIASYALRGSQPASLSGSELFLLNA